MSNTFVIPISMPAHVRQRLFTTAPAGNCTTITNLATLWAGRADDAAAAQKVLEKSKSNITQGDLHLEGTYAPKVTEAIGEIPDSLSKLAGGYRGCSNALSTYATELATAQKLWGEHHVAREQAIRAVLNAEANLEHYRTTRGCQTTYGPYTSTAPQPRACVTFHPFGYGDFGFDPTEANLKALVATNKQAQAAAETLLVQAHDTRDRAEAACAATIRRSLKDNSMKNKSAVGKFFSSDTWETIVTVAKVVGIAVAVIGLVVAACVPGANIAAFFLIGLACSSIGLVDDVYKASTGEQTWDMVALSAGLMVLDVATFGTSKTATNLIRAGRTARVVHNFTSTMKKINVKCINKETAKRFGEETFGSLNGLYEDSKMLKDGKEILMGARDWAEENAKEEREIGADAARKGLPKRLQPTLVTA